MNQEDVVCGYLSPEGILYKCPYYGHMKLAVELVKKFNLTDNDPWSFEEDTLLENGWICIRSGCIYKSVYNKNESIAWITDAQINFFKENKNLFTLTQWTDIENKFQDFDNFYRSNV